MNIKRDRNRARVLNYFVTIKRQATTIVVGPLKTTKPGNKSPRRSQTCVQDPVKIVDAFIAPTPSGVARCSPSWSRHLEHPVQWPTLMHMEVGRDTSASCHAGQCIRSVR